MQGARAGFEDVIDRARRAPALAALFSLFVVARLETMAREAAGQRPRRRT